MCVARSKYWKMGKNTFFCRAKVSAKIFETETRLDIDVARPARDLKPNVYKMSRIFFTQNGEYFNEFPNTLQYTRRYELLNKNYLTYNHQLALPASPGRGPPSVTSRLPVSVQAAKPASHIRILYKKCRVLIEIFLNSINISTLIYFLKLKRLALSIE